MTWPTDDIGHEAAVVSADLLRAVRGPRFEKTAATTAVHADLLRLVGAHPNDHPQRTGHENRFRPGHLAFTG